jgi:hypothetical protein
VPVPAVLEVNAPVTLPVLAYRRRAHSSHELLTKRRLLEMVRDSGFFKQREFNLFGPAKKLAQRAAPAQL